MTPTKRATPPEFGTARFLMSAAAVWAGIVSGVWLLRTSEPMPVRVLIGILVGGFVFIVLPETLRYISEKEAAGSFEKTDAFAADIPVQVSDFGARIPVNNNGHDPLMMTYLTLGGIAQFPSTVRDPQNPELQKPSTDDVSKFVGHILQYYILRSVFEIQNPPVTVDYESGKGMKTNTPSPINVPDAEAFPKDKWLAQIGTLGLAYRRHFGGPDDASLPKDLRLPKGTEVELKIGKSPDTSYMVRFAQPSAYFVEFSIEPSMVSKGVLPQNFVLLQPTEDEAIYTLSFVVRFRFHWTGKQGKADDYQKWATELFSGVKKRLAHGS